LVLWTVLAGTLSACGAQAAQGPTPSSEFGVRETQLFEDGVDLIEDPQGLEGKWRDDWEADLNERISKSDVIASGTVTTVRTDIDLDKRTNYRVVFALDHALKGDKPSPEITLVTRQGAAGYASIERDRQNMLGRKLVVFVKYAAPIEGSGNSAVISHFHLSPNSPVVLDRVGEFESRKHSHRVVVIERTQ
jgi:hypothetical protein